MLTWKSQSTKIRLLFIGAFFIGVFVVLAPQLVGARNSQFSQEIVAVGCNYDTYETGKGKVHNIACPYFSPVISSYERLPGGGFMAYGAYDAIHTDINPLTGQPRLSITFAGKTFTLGIDKELTVDGNAWVLDLSDWRGEDPFLPVKPPSVIKPSATKPTTSVGSQVTTIMKADKNGYKQSLSGSATVTTPNYPEDETAVGTTCEDNTSSDNCQSMTCDDVSWWWLVVVLATIALIEAITIGWLILRRRKEEDDKGSNDKPIDI